ncbi:hypothetical protein GF325_00145, partial [Candidatus Bathyarchaeota archaeon]|nr:hypothetical protein [Candidatus Bathyarchaeota archaeon]
MEWQVNSWKKHAFPSSMIFIILVTSISMAHVPHLDSRNTVNLHQIPIQDSVPNTITYTNPFCEQLSSNSYLSFLQDLLENTLIAPGSPYDGLPRLENANPPSLLVTKEVILALSKMNVTIVEKQQLIDWIWNCWDAMSGNFIDPYSLDYSLATDNGYLVPSNIYSPAVSTASAIIALNALGASIDGNEENKSLEFLGSCWDGIKGAFKGYPSSPAPTIMDTFHVVEAFDVSGKVSLIDADSISSFIVSLEQENCLHIQSSPIIYPPMREMCWDSIANTFQAIEILERIDRLMVVNVSMLQDTLISLYNAEEHMFRPLYYLASNALVTSQIMSIFEVIGFPAMLPGSEQGAILNALASRQDTRGGWSFLDAPWKTSTYYSARIVNNIFSTVNELPSGIDSFKIKVMFADSMISNEQEGTVAFMVEPSSQASLHSISLLLDLVSSLDMEFDLEPYNSYLDSFQGCYMPYPGYTPAFFSLPMPGGWCLNGWGESFAWKQVVTIMRAIDAGFSPILLDELDFFLQGLQVNPGIPVFSGMLASDLFLQDGSFIYPGDALHDIGLKSTITGLQLVELLTPISTPGRFDIDSIFNCTTLVDNLLMMYQESATRAWFDPGHPIDKYQQLEDGIHSPVLEHTRDCLEILFSMDMMEDPRVKQVISWDKIEIMIENEHFCSARDVDNIFSIHEYFGKQVKDSISMGLLACMVEAKLDDECWFLRNGMPSFQETMLGMKVLSKINYMSIAVTGIDPSEEWDGSVMAGTNLMMEVRVNNLVGTKIDGFNFSYTCHRFGIVESSITCNGNTHSISIQTPLSEDILGPMSISFKGEDHLINDVNITLGIISCLRLNQGKSSMMIQASPGNTINISVDLSLHLQSLDLTSPVKNASIIARSLVRDDISFFSPVTNGPQGRYFTFLEMDPTRENMTWHVEATKNYCLNASLILQVSNHAVIKSVPYIL